MMDGGADFLIVETFFDTLNAKAYYEQVVALMDGGADIQRARPLLFSTLRASLREASMVTTALAVTRCSIVLYLVASLANRRRRQCSVLT